MAVLRKASRFWSPARECLVKARVSRGVYKCSKCSAEVGPKNIKIDHIDPVIPVSGFKDWDDVIHRLFCEVSGYQALCKECHDLKTKNENDERKKLKKENCVVEYSSEDKEIDV